MNIEITTHEADQLRVILADAMATAERMILHPGSSEQMVQRLENTAVTCLSVINKIAAAMPEAENRQVYRQRIKEIFHPESTQSLSGSDHV
jgi:hypothetical protein